MPKVSCPACWLLDCGTSDNAPVAHTTVDSLDDRLVTQAFLAMSRLFLHFMNEAALHELEEPQVQCVQSPLWLSLQKVTVVKLFQLYTVTCLTETPTVVYTTYRVYTDLGHLVYFVYKMLAPLHIRSGANVSHIHKVCVHYALSPGAFVSHSLNTLRLLI